MKSAELRAVGESRWKNTLLGQGEQGCPPWLDSVGILLIFLLALLVPWLGETLFNTKGEPREAIVAVSMLQSGNWVLPVSYGIDIPYKPPFLAWLIAIFSWIFNGGVVNEFTSRLPSALAAAAMVACGFVWAKRHAKAGVVWPMALITITSFEVYRAAVACRVDMLLTACIVIGLYQMYEWRERVGIQPLRLLLISLLLSGAVLTKGPVGALLPCLAMGIYCLLRGDNFFKTLVWLTLVCVASMILPAWWYYEAYKMGGSPFLDLAWEENIGRLMGSMGYESHLNPWYYNITTILAGMLPWTLLVLAGGVYFLCSRKASWRSAVTGKQFSRPAASSLFALVVSLVVFIFYCIPASKRSVYLLPMYPFMAYGVALLYIKLKGTGILRGYKWFITSLAILAPLVAIALQWLHPAKMPIEPLAWWMYILALLPVGYGIYAAANKRPSCMLVTYLLYLAYGASFAPMVLNGKSDFHSIAPVVEAHKQGMPIYSYISADSLLRHYTLNFYMGDVLQLLPSSPQASEWALLASPDDVREIACKHTECAVDTVLLSPRSCDTRRPLSLGIFAQR